MNRKGATDDGSPDIIWLLKITAHVFSGRWAVIFASWNHAFHAHTQDCKKSHTVKSLQ